MEVSSTEKPYGQFVHFIEEIANLCQVLNEEYSIRRQEKKRADISIRGKSYHSRWAYILSAVTSHGWDKYWLKLLSVQDVHSKAMS